MTRASRHALGFTLLELVVAIGIFGILSVMAYGGLNSVLNTRHAVEQSLERTAEMQKAYRRLHDDLQQVQNRPARDGYGAPQPAFMNDRDGRVEFTRGGWRNPLYQPRSTLERVSYRLDGKKFLRESWRALDRGQGSEPVKVILLDKVEEVAWRYLDKNGQWQTEWPTQDNSAPLAAEAAPPLAVEVTVRTPDWGTLKFLFRPGLEAAAATPKKS